MELKIHVPVLIPECPGKGLPAIIDSILIPLLEWL